MTYYVLKDGEKSGPFTTEKLKELIACGLISSKDQCWREGLGDWIPILQAFANEDHLSYGSPPPVAFAGFWRRLGAHAVDMLILNIGVVTFTCIICWLGSAINDEQFRPDHETSTKFLGTVFAIVLPWLYYASLESQPYRATPGKRMFGFWVTDLSGQRVTFGRASKRYWCIIFSLLPLFAGFLMCAWTKKRQCLHDKISGCLLPLRG